VTFLEAINALEKKVSKLGIKYKDGTPMEPVAAMGRIGRLHGDRYDQVINDLEHGKITCDAYFLEMMKMIEEYQTREREIA